MNADEIAKALRCDVEQGNEGGSRCYREGEDCRDCPNYYEGGDHIMAIDEMMLAAADAIESLQAQLATERTKYAELNRYNVDNTRIVAKLLVERQELRIMLAASQRREQAARNELCVKCGRYHEAHKGACNGCRWHEPQKAER